MEHFSFQYNKNEHFWHYSNDEGRNVWFIQPAFPGYTVHIGHLQGNSYGNPMAIFHCRYLNEAKNFVRMCVNSKDAQSSKAFRYKYRNGYSAIVEDYV